MELMHFRKRNHNCCSGLVEKQKLKDVCESPQSFSVGLQYFWKNWLTVMVQLAECADGRQMQKQRKAAGSMLHDSADCTCHANNTNQVTCTYYFYK